jgi:hypothetical protein
MFTTTSTKMRQVQFGFEIRFLILRFNPGGGPLPLWGANPLPSRDQRER